MNFSSQMNQCNQCNVTTATEKIATCQQSPNLKNVVYFFIESYVLNTDWGLVLDTAGVCYFKLYDRLAFYKSVGKFVFGQGKQDEQEDTSVADRQSQRCRAQLHFLFTQALFWDSGKKQGPHSSRLFYLQWPSTLHPLLFLLQALFSALDLCASLHSSSFLVSWS